MNNLTTNVTKETATKKRLRKSAKLFLLKMFLVPQIVAGLTFYFISKDAYAGFIMDAARNEEPLLGEWNQLEMALGAGISVFIVGAVFLFIAIVHIAITHSYQFVEVEYELYIAPP